MSSVTTNISALIAQNALRRSSTAMDNAMQRLSTGKRINSGADDTAGLSMSTRIKSHSLSLQQGARNANDAISMVQLYSTAGQKVVDILIEMKELAVRSASSPLNQNDRLGLDHIFNSLGNTWARIATDTNWNRGVTRMNTFNNSFNVRMDDTANFTTMTFKSWDPTNQVANQNIVGATAIIADDNNSRADWAWGFVRTLNSLETPPNPQGKSHSHIQSQAASVNAAAKLDVTIRGATAELARYGAYINRLEIGSLNAREGATILNQSYDKIANTDYAKETIELTRNQIITQAATAILAQANQQGSSVIALLK